MSAFDFSELQKLSADYVRAGSRMYKEARKVVEVHAAKTKKGMNADAGSAVGRRLRGVAGTADYDLSGLNAEIGWRPGRGQSSLAWVAANGTSRMGPLFDHTAAQRRELPATERFLADLGVGLLEP